MYDYIVGCGMFVFCRELLRLFCLMVTTGREIVGWNWTYEICHAN